MNGFKNISPAEITDNAFKLISCDWMLISAAMPDGKINTMTASWGEVGHLWGKDVFTCFVRPQRYTHEFTEASDRITLSFFGEEYRSALTHCGRNSGRDGDKIASAGLTPVIEGGTVGFEQARMIVTGKKLYVSSFDPEKFTDRSLIEKNYPASDFHTIYICEIESVLVKE